MFVREIGGQELREIWVRTVSKRGATTSHELLRELRSEGLIPKGGTYKGWIRNIHSAATHDRRLVKARPGVFELAP